MLSSTDTHVESTTHHFEGEKEGFYGLVAVDTASEQDCSNSYPPLWGVVEICFIAWWLGKAKVD